MNGSGSFLFKLLLRHPHPLESIQRGQDWPSNPCWVQSFLRGTNSDLDVSWSHFFDFVQKSFPKSFEEGWSSRQNDVLIQDFPQIQVWFGYWVNKDFVYSFKLTSNDIRSKENLRGSCSRNGPYFNLTSIWQNIWTSFEVSSCSRMFIPDKWSDKTKIITCLTTTTDSVLTFEKYLTDDKFVPSLFSQLQTQQ